MAACLPVRVYEGWRLMQSHSQQGAAGGPSHTHLPSPHEEARAFEFQ